ncbi:MAG: nicotinamidase [Planctomycetes bacterium]|nr:nicotinamidase [Planctomycetota bacterium]
MGYYVRLRAGSIPIREASTVRLREADNPRRTVHAWTGWATVLRSICWSLALCSAVATAADITVHKQQRAPQTDQEFGVVGSTEKWDSAQTALIVCDVWDAHHCLNAVRRVAEMAPRMNLVLETARKKGCLIIHAPSSCMAPYEKHPARMRAKNAPQASSLPEGISEWCRQIPAEEAGQYPLDQTDGGEDDDPVEHLQWHERLAGMGRTPRSPWRAQYDVIRIDEQDAISDSGVEIWNLLEQRQIRNVVLLGVHTNMCVLGRPFGLRQMAKNGKNVVLMRDMTDTMYNPERWPYVTHYVGTDRIVEHIEKYVCPTITSVDFVGGEPFRFANDLRSIVMMIGEDEYRTEITLPDFATKDLEPKGFQVTVVHSAADDKNTFPGLVEALERADLLFVSVRRRTPPRDQLEAVRKFVAAGKPLVGIRTASHAFSLRDTPPPPEHAAWTTFDPEILGGHYVGHHGVGPKVELAIAPGAAAHPILRGIDARRILGNGSLYRVVPLATTTTPLLNGTFPDTPIEPLAWTNVVRESGNRVFYTSLGHPDDFANPEFRKLLVNGLCWTIGIAAPATPPESFSATGK